MIEAKVFRGWAIVDNDDIAVFDYRLPIMWHKATAEDEIAKRGLVGFTVRKVTITIDEPTKRTKN